MKLTRKITLSLAALLGVVGLYTPSLAAASLSATINVTGSCASQVHVSGATNVINVPAGDNVNITVENTDPVVPQAVNGPGISTQLNNAAKSGASNYIKTFQLGNVTGQLTLTFTPIPTNSTDQVFVSSCPVGSAPVASSITINAVADSTPTKTTPASTQKTTIPATSSSILPSALAEPQLTSVSVAGKSLDKTKPIEFKQSQILKLEGHTVANGLVTLTIHSKPKTITTTADSNGNWSYEIRGLSPGAHYIEATTTDPSSKQMSALVKLLSFKIDASRPVTVKKPSNHALLYLSLIAVLIVAGLTYLLFKKRRPSTPKQIDAVESHPAKVSDSDQSDFVERNIPKSDL